MDDTKMAAKSTIIIIMLTLGSKLLGFLREVLIASKFGSGMETDAFFVALTVSSLATGFISNSISTTFVPVISVVDVKEGKCWKIKHTNNMLNVMFFISCVLVVVGFFLTPAIIKVLAKGFIEEQYNLTVVLARIGLPGILFSGAIGVFTGYLHSEGRFATASAIGFPFNVIFIIFLLFLSKSFGIIGLVITSVVATASQFFILIPEARLSGLKYRWIFDLKDKYLRKVLFLSMPVFVATVINELNIIVDRTIASDLVPGSISALSYAAKINGLINSIFISAIATVIFPILSKEFSSGNIERMKKVMGYGFNVVILITVPAIIGITVLSKTIVQTAFQRGRFDTTATLMTTGALYFYAFGLLAFSIRLLTNKVYYSLQDTRTPMVNGLLYLGINIILDLILVKHMSHKGIALATSIASTVTVISLLYNLRKKIGPMGLLSYIKCGLKSLFASMVMGISIYFLNKGLFNIMNTSTIMGLVSLSICIGSGVLIYSVIIYFFRIKEVEWILGIVKGKLDRFVKAT